MDLQSLFYLVAIVFMVLLISLLLAIAYFITRFQQSIQSMRENIENKTRQLVEAKNSEIAGIAGSLITSFIASRFRNMFKKKKHSHDD